MAKVDVSFTRVTCDRCGGCEEDRRQQNAWSNISLKWNQGGIRVGADLCPNCADSLEAWFRPPAPAGEPVDRIGEDDGA